MNIQFSNKINSSIFLWLNNLLAQEGSGFVNHGSYFYPLKSTINGLYIYGAPFSQFISDFSISGAVVPTGIYINNNFVTGGQSGFVGFNYENGWAYFNQSLPQNTIISGNYSVKDFNIKLTDETEEKILFENKMSLRPKVYIKPTGINNDETSYPVIFIKNDGYKNTPFAFGGTELTKVNYSIFIFGDNKMQVDATESLICDSVRKYVPIFELSEMPYDSYGKLKSGYFNYVSVADRKTPSLSNTAFIEDAYKSKFSQKIYSEIKNVNPEAHFSLINMDLCTVRNPRN